MDRTVKDKVIALASRDPFLTVEQLAEQVETTAPYVRTILSEADLSLNQMRKDYARQLERQLGTSKASNEANFSKTLTVTKVAGALAKPYVNFWHDLELFQARALEEGGDHLSYVELLTPQELNLNKHYRNLRELLPKSSLASLVVGEQWAEVVQAPKELSLALDLPSITQVLKLTTLLMVDNKPYALESKWFAFDGLALNWGRKHSEIKVILTG